jgi:hypothetical protein
VPFLSKQGFVAWAREVNGQMHYPSEQTLQSSRDTWKEKGSLDTRVRFIETCHLQDGEDTGRQGRRELVLERPYRRGGRQSFDQGDFLDLVDVPSLYKFETPTRLQHVLVVEGLLGGHPLVAQHAPELIEG